MGVSTSREVRQKQCEKAQGALEKREEALTAADTDASSMGKDPVLRRLKAELKQARRRLNAIDAAQAQTRKTAEEKKAKSAVQQPAPEKEPEGGKKRKNGKKGKKN